MLKCRKIILLLYHDTLDALGCDLFHNKYVDFTFTTFIGVILGTQFSLQEKINCSMRKI